MSVEDIKLEDQTPEFELVDEDHIWLSLIEGPYLQNIYKAEISTYNSSELVERCFRAWRKKEPIYLDFPSDENPQERIKMQIVAARSHKDDTGDHLTLWLADREDELELDLTDDENSDGEDYEDEED